MLLKNVPSLPPNIVLALEGVLIAGFTYGVYKLFMKISKQRAIKNYPKDVVILHQVPRGLRAPSASPFPIKIETW
jgi:hypothetical protein